MLTLIFLFAIPFSIAIFRNAIDQKETGYDHNFNEL